MPAPRKGPKRTRPKATRPRARAARRPRGPAPDTRRALPIINADPLARVSNARDLFWNNILREMLASLAAISAQRSAPRATPPGAGASPRAVSGAATSVPPRAAPPQTGAPNAPGAEHARAEDEEPDADPELEPAPEEADGDAESPGGAHIVVGEHPVPSTLGRDPSNIFDGRLGVITTWGQRIPIAEITPVFACGLASQDRNWLSTAVECTVFEITTPAGEVYTLPVAHIIAFHSLSEELVREIQRVLRRGGERPGEADQPFGFAAFTSLSRSQNALNDVPEVSPDSFGE